jgi:hypothetical protein
MNRIHSLHCSAANQLINRREKGDILLFFKSTCVTRIAPRKKQNVPVFAQSTDQLINQSTNPSETMNGERMNHYASGRTWTGLLLGFIVGAGVGSAMLVPALSEADVRQSPPRAAFLSGGERSEKVLVEISETLKRIDQRLERLEKHVSMTR